MLSPSFPVNKQLKGKERAAAALENSNLLDTVDECMSPTLGKFFTFMLKMNFPYIYC
jgi:hypothetical protein